MSRAKEKFEVGDWVVVKLRETYSLKLRQQWDGWVARVLRVTESGGVTLAQLPMWPHRNNPGYKDHVNIESYNLELFFRARDMKNPLDIPPRVENNPDSCEP